MCVFGSARRKEGTIDGKVEVAVTSIYFSNIDFFSERIVVKVSAIALLSMVFEVKGWSPYSMGPKCWVGWG